MPERSEADQEGITLPPAETIRLLARKEAEQVIMQHLSLCPFSQDGIQRRLREIETRFGTLVGFMIGSGLIGGATGALLGKLIKQRPNLLPCPTRAPVARL